MSFEGPLEDRILIRELYGTYSDATMRQDRDAYLSCWSEQGVRIARDGEVHGKAAIAAHWDVIWSTIDCMGFFAEIGSILVEGAAARARVHCREIVALRDGGIWKLIGRYDDELVREDGQWRFSRRTYQLVLNEAK